MQRWTLCLYPIVAENVAGNCDPDTNVKSVERFAEQFVVSTSFPRLSTGTVGGLSSPVDGYVKARVFGEQPS